jgi:putative transposase
MHYLWRAVDHECEVLESFATKGRNKVAALKFMKHRMKRHGCAEAITTDGLRSHRAAIKEVGISIARKLVAGLIIERRIRTSHFGAESG